MDKVELYRQVYSAFKKLCAEGNQPSSFNAYCKKHSVDQSQMSYVLRKEYQSVRSFPGYVRDGGTRLAALGYLKISNNYAQKADSRVHSRAIMRVSASPNVKCGTICIGISLQSLDCQAIHVSQEALTREVRKYLSKTLSSRRQVFFPATTRMLFWSFYELGLLFLESYLKPNSLFSERFMS